MPETVPSYPALISWLDEMRATKPETYASLVRTLSWLAELPTAERTDAARGVAELVTLPPRAIYMLLADMAAAPVTGGAA